VSESKEPREPVVVIPARGGSKRIPGKNTRALNGIPVLERTIKIAAECATKDRILVSTDSAEIAHLANSLGVQVLERPLDLADDHTPLLPVMHHALTVLGELGLVTSETAVACLYATAVTLDPTDFTRGLNQLASQSSPRLVTGVIEYPHPVERALTLDGDFHLEPASPQFASTRTQDLPVHYFDAGAFIWGYPRQWHETTPVLTRASGCVLPGWRSVDLDTESDWQRAELVIGQLEARQR